MKNKRILKNVKIKRIQSFLPLFWSSYEHMYTVRKTNMQNSINFLLVLVSFLSAIFVALFVEFKKGTGILFLFPLLLQLYAILEILKSFFIVDGHIPWFKNEETLEKLKLDKSDSNYFSVYALAIIKAGEDNTYSEMMKMGKVVGNSLRSILFSIFSGIMAGMFLFFKTIPNAYLILIYLIITTVLFVSFIKFFPYIIKYMKKEEFNFANAERKYKAQIEKWIDEF